MYDTLHGLHNAHAEIRKLRYLSQETLQIHGLSALVIRNFFVASSRISVESSKGVHGIVKGCPRICRRPSAQSQSTKASAESYCIPRILEG